MGQRRAYQNYREWPHHGSRSFWGDLGRNPSLSMDTVSLYLNKFGCVNPDEKTSATAASVVLLSQFGANALRAPQVLINTCYQQMKAPREHAHARFCKAGGGYRHACAYATTCMLLARAPVARTCRRASKGLPAGKVSPSMGTWSLYRPALWNSCRYARSWPCRCSRKATHQSYARFPWRQFLG